MGNRKKEAARHEKWAGERKKRKSRRLQTGTRGQEEGGGIRHSSSGGGTCFQEGLRPCERERGSGSVLVTVQVKKKGFPHVPLKGIIWGA